MPLARVKTWNAGDTLTAADQNAEFNNILNNPISLVSPTTGAINFQTSVAHTNLAPSAITASSGGAGAVLIASTTPSTIWLGVGTSGQVLNVSTSGVPAWSNRTIIGTYTAGTSAPSVAGGVSYLSIANSTATTISQFAGGVIGQALFVRFVDANTTVDRTNCVLSGSVNYTSTANATLSLVAVTTVPLWVELARSTNNG